VKIASKLEISGVGAFSKVALFGLS